MSFTEIERSSLLQFILKIYKYSLFLQAIEREELFDKTRKIIYKLHRH